MSDYTKVMEAARLLERVRRGEVSASMSGLEYYPDEVALLKTLGRLKWTHEPPTEPGTYWVGRGDRKWTIYFGKDDLGWGLYQEGEGYRFSGPIPEPE